MKVGGKAGGNAGTAVSSGGGLLRWSTRILVSANYATYLAIAPFTASNARRSPQTTHPSNLPGPPFTKPSYRFALPTWKPVANCRYLHTAQRDAHCHVPSVRRLVQLLPAQAAHLAML